MIEKVRADIRPKVQELVQKWDGFLGKVSSRIDEVVAEANAGLDQLIAQHAMDHGPMGAAFSALQARFHGLSTKVDDAWEKIDNEYDEVRDADDLGHADYDVLNEIWEQMHAKYRAMNDRLDLTHYEVEMRKNADWARRLRQIADQEIQQGAKCSQCGTPIHLEVWHQPSQQKCPSCGAVNDVSPGTATAMFAKGLGAHALAHEAAWQEWLAERAAKDEFDKKRHPTAYDYWVYTQAAQAYWTKYYQVGTSIYPSFCSSLHEAVEAKMKHYFAWVTPVDQQARDFMGQVIDAAGKGDWNTLQQLNQNRPHHVDDEACAEACVERKLYQAALVLLNNDQDELQEMRKFLRS